MKGRQKETVTGEKMEPRRVGRDQGRLVEEDTT